MKPIEYNRLLRKGFIMFWKICTLFFASFLAFASMADEPNTLIISTKDAHKEIDFSKLKTVSLKTVNLHPQFIKLGEVEYQGYSFKDLLKNYSLKPQQPVVLLGTTGEFSLELKAEEILGDDVILATHKNGQRISAKDQGNQIIYGTKTVQKYPHLKERLYWLWWVRNIVLDNTYQNDFNEHKAALVQLSSTIPFPQPDGISSLSASAPVKNLSGKILDVSKTKNLKVHLINNSVMEIPVKKNFSYFLSNAESLKSGGETLHIVEIKNGKVTNLISHMFYIKKIELL